MTIAAPEMPRTIPARSALLATGAVLAAMASVNLARHVWSDATWLGPVAALVLLAFARWSGLTWAQLGLHRDRLRSGARWGFGAAALVALVYLAGVLLPLTRPAFLDARYHLGVSGALLTAFVVIPLGTVVFEEIAFRSVLWGMLARHATTMRVLLISSALFGLWHILPSLNIATANAGIGDLVGGTGSAAQVIVIAAIVVFTAGGGIVAGELRRRSGSVLASAGMHWATNSLGVLFGLVAWRMVA
ncbi:lysostaphin resistance A-like protein [Actinotalea sp.]|uniref:CPBP family intramembrane glutamic endopeptidase n=1 Tax=Actinotalea sp. TaxID=1872145 RepID=UPI0035695E82